MASGGSGQLSVLADLLKKQQNAKNQNRKSKPGWGRPTYGSTGAQPFKGRNSQAGLNKEREMLNSPIMQEFMRKPTPIFDKFGMGR